MALVTSVKTFNHLGKDTQTGSHFRVMTELCLPVSAGMPLRAEGMTVPLSSEAFRWVVQQVHRDQLPFAFRSEVVTFLIRMGLEKQASGLQGPLL